MIVLAEKNLRGERDTWRKKEQSGRNGVYTRTQVRYVPKDTITSEERWSQSSKSFTVTGFSFSPGIAGATQANSELPQRQLRISRRLDP